MSIDLDTAEGRKEYLTEKLDDILDGINESYGTVLMEELLKRLELTIRDFNDEMKTLCDQLFKKQEERQNLLQMIKTKESMTSQTVTDEFPYIDDSKPSDITSSEKIENENEHSSNKDSDEDIPAWEKKLSKLEKIIK